MFETPDRLVGAAEIIDFAEAFDPQRFHTDPSAAGASVFGTHVASGWHTAALTMRLWVDHHPPVAGGIVGLGADEIRWAPLRPGDWCRPDRRERPHVNHPAGGRRSVRRL